MQLSWGAIAFPLMILIPALQQRGPATVFLRAGATSPDTARRPGSIKAKGNMEGAIKSGVLIDLGDGRYYVNEGRYRQRRARLTWAFAGVGVGLAAATLLIWPPW
jgi:hypothetical protein